MAAQEDATFPVIDAPPEGGDVAGFPINRIVAFIGPQISWIAGLIATWLVTKVDVLGIPGLDQHNTATWLSGAITFIVVSVLTWLGHQQWLKGHHIELRNAGLLAATANSPLNGAPLGAPQGEYDPTTAALPGDNGTPEDKQDDEELGRGQPLGWDRS